MKYGEGTEQFRMLLKRMTILSKRNRFNTDLIYEMECAILRIIECIASEYTHNDNHLISLCPIIFALSPTVSKT